jgi:hypothetical protein
VLKTPVKQEKKTPKMEKKTASAKERPSLLVRDKIIQLQIIAKTGTFVENLTG